MRTHFFDDRDEQYKPGPDAILNDPADVAAAVMFALAQPPGCAVRELVVAGATETSSVPVILVLRALGVGDGSPAVPALRGAAAASPAGDELVLACAHPVADLLLAHGIVDRVVPHRRARARRPARSGRARRGQPARPRPAEPPAAAPPASRRGCSPSATRRPA